MSEELGIIKQFKILNEEYKQESDRATVILTCAMLESALEIVLKARLVPSATSNDNFIEGAYAPISSFNAKIDLAFRIGLISTKFCRDIHIIRKIRNYFAHNISNCNFENSNIYNRITELMRSSGIKKKTPKLRDMYPKGPRGDYLVTISWMLWVLWYLIDNVNSLSPAGDEFIYGPGPKEEEFLKESEASGAHRPPGSEGR